jgi:DNA-binding response OmpR family regulator
MRVLLVEADHAVRDKLKVALQQFDGTSVDFAEDSWALELARSNEYDLLVISDVLHAPGDGIKLLQDLRAGGLMGPAILLSKDRGSAELKDREAVNVSVVLTAPPDTVEIFKAIVSAQDRMAGRQQG